MKLMVQSSISSTRLLTQLLALALGAQLALAQGWIDGRVSARMY